MRRFIPTKPTTLSEIQPILDNTLHVNQSIKTANSSLLWGITNSIFCLIIYYDFIYTCPGYFSTFQYIEAAFAFLLAANSIFHFYRYFKNTFWLKPVLMNPKQKKLLGVKDGDPHFKVASSPPPTSNAMNTSFSPSRLSMSHNESMSPNFSMSSPSWIYRQGSPDMTLPPTPNDSLRQRQSLNTSLFSNASSTSGLIEDEQSLSQYLKDFDVNEKKAVVSLSVEQPPNLLRSFWSHPATRTSNEMSPMLRRCTYQMAPPTPTQTSNGSVGSGAIDDNGSPSSSLYQSHEVWRRVGVNPNILTQWNANLRMWISQTVLKRLVDEITIVDAALLRQGLSDVRIGAVGLERLKKTAQIAQVSQNIPTLLSLIPFLEVTPHQEYLVSRIKDLARGGCMSEFRWNGGGSLHGRDWEENLPTDSTIVMHMLATYLDSQLPPLTKSPDGRPFTSQYLVKSPEKPDKDANHLLIYQTHINPPYYVVMVKQDTIFKLPRGQSNLFNTILLFMHLVRTQESGMLGRVNLGPSGINMLWVIEA